MNIDNDQLEKLSELMTRQCELKNLQNHVEDLRAANAALDKAMAELKTLRAQRDRTVQVLKHWLPYAQNENVLGICRTVATRLMEDVLWALGE